MATKPQAQVQPTDASDSPRSGIRAAVKPRTSRSTSPQPVPQPPVSSRGQYFRSLTATREDWPILPPSSPPPAASPPTFGISPRPQAEARHSLPPFLPPAAMALTPSAPPARARAANDETGSNADLSPFSIDASVAGAVAARRPTIAFVVLFALGVVAGVVATLAAQSF